jgi:hypothetical protein
MNHTTIKTGYVLMAFLLAQFGGTFYQESLGAPLGDKMIPTVSGLDFDKVSFSIDTVPEFTDQLYARALKQLMNAGLYRGEKKGSSSEKTASLILRLDPIPIENCPGRFMYVSKLELWETVIPERNSKITVQSVTWSYGLSIPTIIYDVPFEQLQADLDRYLFEFIRAYKMGNPGKRD